MKVILAIIAMLSWCELSQCEEIPPLASRHLPGLVSAQQELWPDAPEPWFLAGQIEQESCVSLSSDKCWNPRAELKTRRENGVGLGQFTRAFKSDGSIRFDKISELAAAHSSLRGWSWEKRYDAGYQLKAIVEMDRSIFVRQLEAHSARDRMSFTLSAYNGGEGGVLQDRRLCANTHGCNPGIWKDNVEKTSMKSRSPAGYAKSFFQINREYVKNIMDVRREKYRQYFVY